MSTRFVCLANSYKEGGRCIAGIVLDKDNNPIFENGRPKWIRPICNTLHGEVYTHLAAHVNILNVIEINVTTYPEWSYQSENVFFNENNIKVAGKFNKCDLDILCDNNALIFGNKGKAVHREKIDKLDHSLMLIRISDFEVLRKAGDEPGKPKFRLMLSHRDVEYDFPITDPAFIERFQSNSKLLLNTKELFVCVSLGIVLNDWHYKLVAGIIPAIG
jgi:hypothetical protein